MRITRIFIPLIVLILSYTQIWASCVAFCASYEVDTLSSDSIQIKCMRDSITVTSIDTTTKNEVLDRLSVLYDSLNFCLIVNIDTVFQYFSQPDSNGVRTSVDSIGLSIDTVLKGNLNSEYIWTVDTDRYPKYLIWEGLKDTLITIDRGGITMVPSSGNYRSLLGQKFILFYDSIDSARGTTVKPAGSCVFETRGFGIRDNKMIYNFAEFPFIEVPLSDFLSRINPSILLNADSGTNSPFTYFSSSNKLWFLDRNDITGKKYSHGNYKGIFN